MMKNLLLVLVLLPGLFALNPAIAQIVDDGTEGEARVWEHTIDLLDQRASRIVVGDREFYYKGSVKVLDQSGKRLPLTALKRGVKVSVKPLVRNNTSYADEIVVLGR